MSLLSSFISSSFGGGDIGTVSELITDSFMGSNNNNNNNNINNNNYEKSFNDDPKEPLDKLVSKVARRELGETDEVRELAVKQLRTWVENNSDLQNVRADDDFLLRFLRVKKFNIQLSQQLILKYLNLRSHFPHMIANLDYLASPIDELMRAGYCVASPYRDKFGRRVTMCHLSKCFYV